MTHRVACAVGCILDMIAALAIPNAVVAIAPTNQRGDIANVCGPLMPASLANALHVHLSRVRWPFDHAPNWSVSLFRPPVKSLHVPHVTLSSPYGTDLATGDPCQDSSTECDDGTHLLT